MLIYTIKRILQAIPVLVVVAIGVFAMAHLLPGNPVEAAAGADASAADIAKMTAKYGFDRPVSEQFLTWVTAFMRGDFGTSFTTGQPVSSMMATTLPVTVTLAVCAIIVCLGIGIPAAVTAALHKGKFLDQLVLSGSLIGISAPIFVLGIVLILVFSVLLGILPSSGYTPLFENPGQSLKFFVLPAFTLGLMYSANLARIGRAATLEVLSMDFVTTARASGISEFSVRYRHVLKNSMIPIVTVVGITFGGLLGGTVVTERVFNLPGVGTMIINAITRRDYPVIQAAVLLVAVSYLVINLLVDILYAAIDPKVRYGSE